MPPSPFWNKPLDQMTDAEWESLCDGCGKCCLIKMEYEDSGEVVFTDVSCKLLDTGTCRCTDYPGRKAQVPDCVHLRGEDVATLGFLPPSCAYRRLARGQGLPWWHHLRSGDPEAVHRAGYSARGRVTSETEVPDREMLDHIVDWPARL